MNAYVLLIEFPSSMCDIVSAWNVKEVDRCLVGNTCKYTVAPKFGPAGCNVKSGLAGNLHYIRCIIHIKNIAHIVILDLSHIFYRCAYLGPYHTYALWGPVGPSCKKRRWLGLFCCKNSEGEKVKLFPLCFYLIIDNWIEGCFSPWRCKKNFYQT